MDALDLGDAYGAAFRLLAAIDLLRDAAVGVWVREQTATGLRTSRRDDVLDAIVGQLRTGTFGATSGPLHFAHPRAAARVLDAAEALLVELPTRGLPKGARIDDVLPIEHQLGVPAKHLSAAAARIDRKIARTRFSAWRKRGDTLALAGIYGLHCLLPPAKGAKLDTLQLAVTRINDPALTKLTKLL